MARRCRYSRLPQLPLSKKIVLNWNTSSEQGRDPEAFSVDQYVSRTAQTALRALAGVVEPAARVFLPRVHDLANVLRERLRGAQHG